MPNSSSHEAEWNRKELYPGLTDGVPRCTGQSVGFMRKWGKKSMGASARDLNRSGETRSSFMFARNKPSFSEINFILVASST